MTIEIVDFPIKHGGSFHSYVNGWMARQVSVLACGVGGLEDD